MAPGSRSPGLSHGAGRGLMKRKQGWGGQQLATTNWGGLPYPEPGWPSPASAAQSAARSPSDSPPWPHNSRSRHVGNRHLVVRNRQRRFKGPPPRCAKPACDHESAAIVLYGLPEGPALRKAIQFSTGHAMLCSAGDGAPDPRDCSARGWMGMGRGWEQRGLSSGSLRKRLTPRAGAELRGREPGAAGR